MPRLWHRPAPNEAPPGADTDIAEYPNYGGEVDCEAGTFNGAAVHRQHQDDRGARPVDGRVHFCDPNVAFLPRWRSRRSPSTTPSTSSHHAPDRSIVDQPNGTGPYKFGEWRRGDRDHPRAPTPTTGASSPRARPRVSGGTTEPGQKFIELSRGAVDGIDNPGQDDLAAIEGDAALQSCPREGINTIYLGMNNKYAPWNNEKVRQAIALGIDRQALVDKFFPAGSAVATTSRPARSRSPAAGMPGPSSTRRPPRRCSPRASPRSASQSTVSGHPRRRTVQPTVA